MNSWDEYWLAGYLSSFPDDPKGIYKNSVSAFWIFRVNELSAGAKRVLEIGAGNGELTAHLLPLIRARQSSVNYIATDAAEIDPKVYEKRGLDSIEVQGTVFAEELSFKDSSFDFIVSQFGVEYANWSLVLPEISKKLKTEGSFCAVCHHRNSILIEQQKPFLLREEATQLLNILATICTPNKKDKGQRKLQSYMNILPFEKEKGLQESGFLNDFRYVLSRIPNETPEALLALVSNMKERFINYFARMEDMDRAALTDKQLKELEANALELGLQWHKPQEIHIEGKLIGVGLHLTKL